MKADQLLKTKLNKPHSHSGIIERSLLIKQINSNLERRIILIPATAKIIVEP